MDVESYIEAVRWKFAKTMPENPHEYTVKHWRPDLADDFEAFVLHIRAHGTRRRFYSQTYVYLEQGGHEYWTMGSPLPETIIINRALIKEQEDDREDSYQPNPKRA